MEIAKAYGYAGLLYGVPRVSPGGNKLAYSQMVDEGIGVFVLDLASGQKRMLHEKVSADDWFQNVDVWPWSPDGKYFVFTHTNLFIVNDDTRKLVGGLPVEGLNGVTSLAWLNSTSLVYVSRAGNLHEIVESPEGQWQELGDRQVKASADHLTLTTKDTICWKKGNYIWSFNLASNRPTVLYHALADKLEDFEYSSKRGQFLVNGSSTSGSAIRRMTYNGGPLENGPLIHTASSAHSVKWLDGEDRFCAYIGSDPAKPEVRCLELGAGAKISSVRLFEHGVVDGLVASPDGARLFIVGTMSNEPASSIWEYTTKSGGLKCLVPGSDYPSAHATRVESQSMTVSLGGRTFNYHVYEPTGLNPKVRGQYPLVIGDTLFKVLDPAYQNRVHGPYWAPMLANAGAYVVIVERPGAWFNEMDRWEEYVDWVWRKMIKNPTIDQNQVYLYATSAETFQLSNYVNEHPSPWRGLILLSPGVLPDLRKLSGLTNPPKILISQGELEGTNRIYQYQLKAAHAGVRVEYVTHPNNAHILLGKKALGQRAEAMMKFVFGD
jgi:dipeptidyl aminopeptidase/acylaminoacyl peptidase